jgi:hypothetical protein
MRLFFRVEECLNWLTFLVQVHVVLHLYWKCVAVLPALGGLEYYLIRDNMRNNCFPDRNYGSNSCRRTDGQLSSIFDFTHTCLGSTWTNTGEQSTLFKNHTFSREFLKISCTVCPSFGELVDIIWDAAHNGKMILGIFEIQHSLIL